MASWVRSDLGEKARHLGKTETYPTCLKSRFISFDWQLLMLIYNQYSLLLTCFTVEVKFAKKPVKYTLTI